MRSALLTLLFSLLLFFTSNLASADSSRSTWPDLSDLMLQSTFQGGGEKDAALIIGIDAYDHIAPVPGAVSNAEDWEKYFLTVRGLSSSKIQILKNEKGVKSKILKKLEQVAMDVGPNALLWIVFIGHGIPTNDGNDLLLLGANAQQDPDIINATGISKNAMLELANTGFHRKIVMVIDTCFSGRIGSEKSDSLFGKHQAIRIVRDNAYSGRNATLLTAGRKDQWAGPLQQGQSRPAFSYLLLGALLGWADNDLIGNHDQKVTVREAVAYAGRAIRDTTNRDQEPQFFPSEDSEMVLAIRAKSHGPNLKGFKPVPQPTPPNPFGVIPDLPPAPKITKTGELPPEDLFGISEEFYDQLNHAWDVEDNSSTSYSEKANAWEEVINHVDAKPKHITVAKKAVAMYETAEKKKAARSLELRKAFLQWRKHKSLLKKLLDAPARRIPPKKKDWYKQQFELAYKRFNEDFEKIQNGTHEIVNYFDKGVEFVWIPGDHFMPEEEKSKSADQEKEYVTVDSFYISRSPITYKQYEICVLNSDCNKLGYPVNNDGEWQNPQPKTAYVNEIDTYSAVRYCTFVSSNTPNKFQLELAIKNGTDTISDSSYSLQALGDNLEWTSSSPRYSSAYAILRIEDANTIGWEYVSRESANISFRCAIVDSEVNNDNEP